MSVGSRYVAGVSEVEISDPSLMARAGGVGVVLGESDAPNELYARTGSDLTPGSLH